MRNGRGDLFQLQDVGPAILMYLYCFHKINFYKNKISYKAGERNCMKRLFLMSCLAETPKVRLNRRVKWA
jgi:hypothetical protein